MHTRKLAIVLGVMLSTGMVVAQAEAQVQPPQSGAAMAGQQHEMNPDRQAENLGKKLNLNSNQVGQIKSILEDAKQQIDDVSSDTSLLVRDRRVRIRAIHQDSNSKIEDVLTDQQKQQFEQMQQHMRRGAYPPPPPQ